MRQFNLINETKPLYGPSYKAVSIVDVPEFTYLMIDGQGDPNTSDSYADAIEALFSVSYAAKFIVKKGAGGVDYKVMPLQSLWWSDEQCDFTAIDKSLWKWTAMILQPVFASPEVIEAATGQVAEKKKLPALELLRVEKFAEGRCAQILHVGPFSEEGPTVAKLHRHIGEVGGKPRGRHHEIYLSDVRKAAPEKWKTIIRQPICAPEIFE